MKNIATALVALAVSLAPIGCGDDDSATTQTSSGPTEGVEKPGVAVGGGGRISDHGKNASEIRVEATQEGIAYKDDEVTIEAGEAFIHFENPQSTPHDIDLETSEGQLIADMETIARGYAEVPIDNLEPGEYKFYCTVPGHRDEGMEGTLTVEPR
jgi:plastocyanin